MSGGYYGGYGPPGELEDGRWGGSGSGSGRGRRLKVLAALVIVAFSVTLAAVIGQRLSDQAVSILAGAVCGVAASIPTSLLIIWVSRRQQESDRRPERHTPGIYPPVVVVQPPSQPSGASYQVPGYLPPNVQPMPREFTVVGGETDEWQHQRH
jgi:hypothetical protein